MSLNLNARGVKKIVVLRANALGDFIFALPALTALRDAYPKAEIVLLGKTWAKNFVPGRAQAIDRVVPAPPCPGVGEPEDSQPDEQLLKEFFTRMQQEKFDIAIQMHGGGRHSGPFLKRLGAKITVGLRAPDAPEFDISIPYVFYQNEVMRYLEVVSCLGATTDEIAPQVDVLPEDLQEARQKIGFHSPYAIIHPGATDPRRRWPPERFAEVANYLISENYRVFVTGIEEEAEVVRAVVAGTKNRAKNLTGVLSLGGLAGALAQSEIVVSNDTGPLHLANAVGAKTVGIFWVGNLINGGHPFRMFHRPLISWTTNCPQCGVSCVSEHPFGEKACHHQVSFVTDVTASQVLVACESLIAKK